jgi:hypothetical protein
MTAGLSAGKQVERYGGPGRTVTHSDLVTSVEQYRAGLEAVVMLLHRLQALSIEQRRASQTGSISELQSIVDGRDRIMTTLVTVEHELTAVRRHVANDRERLADFPAFQDVVARHQEACELVADILAVDRDSLDAVNDAEEARRLAARSLEQGERTLAAYHRVVGPGFASATMVSRKG